MRNNLEPKRAERSVEGGVRAGPEAETNEAAREAEARCRAGQEAEARKEREK